VATHHLYNCRACGTSNTTLLTETSLLVCQNCGGIVFENVTDIQKPVPARIPDDWSFLQLKSTGTYNDQAFTIVGRLRLQLKNDYKNFWCGAFADGNHIWLMESFASFAVLQSGWETTLKQTPDLLAGASITLPDNVRLIGEYVEKCEGVSYAGEIGHWKLFYPGFFLVQGSSADGKTAIFTIQGGSIEYLTGEKIEIKALNLKNILAWDEWK
jgi:hypothetical protein